MTKEQQPLSLSAIRVNLVNRSILFEADGEIVGQLTLSEAGLVLQAVSAASLEAPVAAETAAVRDEPPSKERDETVVLSGRLRADPKEGRPDRSGNPTAWAPFAARPQEGEEPHVYSATLHRGTVPVVLKLSKGGCHHGARVCPGVRRPRAHGLSVGSGPPELSGQGEEGRVVPPLKPLICA